MQLVAENLTLVRGIRTIAKGVSFEVPRGSALILTGPNGSGKSTLLRTLAGYIRPAEGCVRWEGRQAASDFDDEAAEVREVCHFVGHLDGIKTHLTVEENLSFWRDYLDGGRSAISIDAALERFSLDALAAIPGGYLSAGQKRRLGLARLLVAPRPLWLLDEPTVSLDAASTDVLAGVINDHLRGGGIAVVATHIPMHIEPAQKLRLGAATAEASE